MLITSFRNIYSHGVIRAVSFSVNARGADGERTGSGQSPRYRSAFRNIILAPYSSASARSFRNPAHHYPAAFLY